MELVVGLHVMTFITMIASFLIEVHQPFPFQLNISREKHALNHLHDLCPNRRFPYAATVQWKRLIVSNEPPPARAYHSMTRIGPRFLLIGGYDGKSTFGDMWWLVSEGLFFLSQYSTSNFTMQL